MINQVKYLYTVFLMWDDGMFIEQVEAKSVRAAQSKWLKRMATQIDDGTSSLPDVKRAHWSKFAKGILLEKVIPLEGVTNIWCTTGRLKRKYALVNFVRTLEIKGGTKEV